MEVNLAFFYSKLNSRNKWILFMANNTKKVVIKFHNSMRKFLKIEKTNN